MSTSTKLNPIYNAIDAYQYNRAIKLASALPDSNVLGKALLAHSYAKVGQKDLAVITLSNILILGSSSGHSFYELQLVLEQQQTNDSSSSTSSLSPSSLPTPTASSKADSATASGKKGKKGKKKPAKQQQRQRQLQQQPADAVKSLPDLIDRLDKQPSLPNEYDPSSLLSLDDHLVDDVITDETTLATIAGSLKSLNLPLTTFQLYALAADTTPTAFNLTKTFNYGLSFLAERSRWNTESTSKLETQVLSHMQTIAMQLARVAASEKDDSLLMLATAWACQSALWQLEWLPENDQRSSILPRLAESMGKRLIQQENERKQPSKEIRLLCLRALERQSKWDEMLQILESIPRVNYESPTNDYTRSTVDGGVSVFGVSFPENQIKLQSAKLLKKLDRFDDARSLYENLLQANSDDWSCWKAHLECSMLENNDFSLTQALVERVNKDRKGSTFPLRGPHLMLIEIEVENLRQSMTDIALRELGDAIRQYADIFAHRANCAFTDLDHYLSIVIRSETNSSNKNVTISLLEFAESLRRSNTTSGNIADAKEAVCGTNKERQAKLRAYIFALKVTHKIITANTDLAENYLPNWIEIVREWQATLSLSSSNEGEETQRELKPGDDLILLTVQQLLFTKSSDNAKFVSAVLLETAIQHSPDNAYLKFSAMGVFHQLNSTTRTWEHFQTIGLKHIQLDSCSFTIFPYLFEGGLYNEAIEVCTSLLRFQNGTARDCGDFAGKAMNSGILTKANEFMVFQRQRMNQSLTSLYSKGMILDAAPLLASETITTKKDNNPILKGSIGTTQGIVGGNEDINRATKMVAQIYNPFAALSVVSYVKGYDTYDYLSDNRDTSILNRNSILLRPNIESKRRMIQTTLRRGRIHALLLRAALCVDAMKGPKKGKVIKPGIVLEKRTQSLLDCILEASEFFGSEIDDRDTACAINGCQEEFAHVFLSLCRVLAVVNAGMPKMDEDSMQQRENSAVKIIQDEALVQLKMAREKISFACNPKVVGAILPNHILPIFAVFRMCSTVCNTYGWGKRKTKKVSVAMAAFSEEFELLVRDNLMASLSILPTSDIDSSVEYPLDEIESSLLDNDIVLATRMILQQGQYRMRMRIEPILEEMVCVLQE